MTTYGVMVTREDGLWVADIHGEGLGPAATDVERFADLDVEVRDLIAGLTDTDPDSFGLTWQYLISGVDATDMVRALAAAERRFAEASRIREAARLAVINQLRRAGVSQSVIGDVLGLSHQRVHQLVNESVRVKFVEASEAAFREGGEVLSVEELVALLRESLRRSKEASAHRTSPRVDA